MSVLRHVIEKLSFISQVYTCFSAKLLSAYCGKCLIFNMIEKKTSILEFLFPKKFFFIYQFCQFYFDVRLVIIFNEHYLHKNIS